MKIAFPSREFDEVVAAICHGLASDEQARALNELLRSDAAARDEYVLRLEVHSRLASEPDLFPQANENKIPAAENIFLFNFHNAHSKAGGFSRWRPVALLAAGWWSADSHNRANAKATSKAIRWNRVVELSGMRPKRRDWEHR